MKIDFIDLKSQYQTLKTSIDDRIRQVIDHGQFIMGPEVRELEIKLEEYINAPYCITVSSGTDALLIALMALGISRGDEVITTPFSFAATVEVIALLGATPVFVDIQPDTCNLDSRLLEASITGKTKAIIPVSLYGQSCDMDEINAVAERYGIIVIEDAAQSFGASYRGRKSCNLSTIACTSFFPSKPLGCYGDGGAIFTNDETLATIMRQLRVHGQERRYFHSRIGVGGRMDTLQCAIVLAKLEKFDWEVQRRQDIGNLYLQMLDDILGITLPTPRPDRTCIWGQFTLQTDDRDMLVSRLSDAGIPTAIHYPLPLHKQPAYENICRIPGTLENADRVARRVVSLPMHPFLNLDMQKQVVTAVKMAVNA